MYEKRIGRVCVVLSQDDITEGDAEAIVNDANDHLWMEAGVARCDQAQGGGSIEAVVLGPHFRGRSRGGRWWLFASPLWDSLCRYGTGPSDLREHRRSPRGCELAPRRRGTLANIAFLDIGTGVGGLSVETTARRMLRAAVFRLSSPEGSSRRIEFVLFTEKDLRTFAAAVDDVGG